MSKQFYILLIAMLGFFMIPMWSYACGTKTVKKEQTCYKPEHKQLNNKNCCEKSHPNKNKKDDSCSGKCKKTSCQCPGNSSSIVLPFISQLTAENYLAEKQNFFHTESHLSSGFHSIWQPPKLG